MPAIDYTSVVGVKKLLLSRPTRLTASSQVSRYNDKYENCSHRG